MKVLSVVGPADAGTSELIETLTRSLTDRGPVSTITRDPPIDETDTGLDRYRSAGASATYGVTADGEWIGAESLSLDAVLDRLAPTSEYVVVEGYADSTLPKVVLGGESAADPVIATASDATQVDVDGLLATIEQFEPHETLGSLIARAEQSEHADRAGAIATFTGRVRRRDHDDDVPTLRLEYERYDGVATEQIDGIATELEAREGVYEVFFHHRTGTVEAGEDAVYVVVLAGHRAEAFAAVEDAIDRLKAEVPLFKKEVTVEGEYWDHQRPNP